MGLKALAVHSVSRIDNTTNTTKTKSENVGASSLELMDGDVSCKIGKMNTLTWNQTSKFGGYQVIHAFDKDMSFDLNIQFDSAGYKVKEGKSTMGSKHWISHKFVPTCTVTGKYTLNGKDCPANGTALYVDASSTLASHAAANQWDLCVFQNGNNNLSSISFDSPSKYGGRKIHQGAVTLDNSIAAITVDNTAKHMSTQQDKDTAYNLPTQIAFEWKGKSVDGEAVTASITANLSSPTGRIDVLGELPWMIRKVVQALVAKPFVYMWLVKDAVAKVKIGSKELELKGQLFIETTFVNV